MPIDHTAYAPKRIVTTPAVITALYSFVVLCKY